jgi:hypothetical protein
LVQTGHSALDENVMLRILCTDLMKYSAKMNVLIWPRKLLDKFFFRKTPNTGPQIEGVLAYFAHLKCQKRIEDDVGDFKYVFTTKQNNKFVCKNDTPDMFYPPCNARICHKMYP